LTSWNKSRLRSSECESHRWFMGSGRQFAKWIIWGQAWHLLFSTTVCRRSGGLAQQLLDVDAKVNTTHAWRIDSGRIWTADLVSFFNPRFSRTRWKRCRRWKTKRRPVRRGATRTCGRIRSDDARPRACGDALQASGRTNGLRALEGGSGARAGFRSFGERALGIVS